VCPANDNAESKTSRVHPKEAHHQIENLPPLSLELKSGEKVDAAGLAKSFGLEFRGVAGMSTEVWYVGQREEQSEGLAQSATVARKSPEVVYLGAREKPDKDLPLRMKDSFSEGGEYY
jgi:hypothetical protein